MSQHFSDGEISKDFDEKVPSTSHNNVPIKTEPSSIQFVNHQSTHQPISTQPTSQSIPQYDNIHFYPQIPPPPPPHIPHSTSHVTPFVAPAQYPWPYNRYQEFHSMQANPWNYCKQSTPSTTMSHQLRWNHHNPRGEDRHRSYPHHQYPKGRSFNFPPRRDDSLREERGPRREDSHHRYDAPFRRESSYRREDDSSSDRQRDSRHKRDPDRRHRDSIKPSKDKNTNKRSYESKEHSNKNKKSKGEKGDVKSNYVSDDEYDDDIGDMTDIKTQLSNDVKSAYIQCTQHGDYYKRLTKEDSTVTATSKLQQLYDKFESCLAHRHKNLIKPFNPESDCGSRKYEDQSLKGMIQINEKVLEQWQKQIQPTKHQLVKSKKVLSGLKKEAKNCQKSLIEFLNFKVPSIPLFAVQTIKTAVQFDSDDEGALSSSSGDDEDFNATVNEAGDQIDNIKRLRKHSDALHLELCFNAPNWQNDGQLCQCAPEDKKSGIRHGIYPGEQMPPLLNPLENNLNKLYHYRIVVGPVCNFSTQQPTTIHFGGRAYEFEGFSVFSHHKLDDLFPCDMIRYSIRYAICLIDEDPPENFTFRGISLFQEYLFNEILELYDWCNQLVHKDKRSSTQRIFHFYPRFVHELPEKGKEILSLCQVLKYLLDSDKPLVDGNHLDWVMECDHSDWIKYCSKVQGMIVTYPGKRPSSLRLDNLDRYNRSPLEIAAKELNMPEDHRWPLIIHFGLRPASLSYAGDSTYQRLKRTWLKQKHLMQNSHEVTAKDEMKYRQRFNSLQRIKKNKKLQRDVTIEVSSYGFRRTGIFADICQHALLLPVLTHHMRYHLCLGELENKIEYKFKNRKDLMHALSHPSCQMNFGLNPDHVRNALTNTGLRLPTYGNPSIHYKYNRKRGITTLIKIMARFGRNYPSLSPIDHNERLEFLGDSVVGLLTSLHLFLLFPKVAEGGLSSFRQSLVNNRYLSLLAQKMDLDKYMLYSHGPDLCRRTDLLHAMANCFEALMGAIYIETEDIEQVRPVFARLLWQDSPELMDAWTKLPLHPLQEAEPWTDRYFIKEAQALKHLVEFEDSIGVKFNHIRLLAKAFTWRDVINDTHLTHGHNERLEFLGDSVCNLIASTYLFKLYPVHHEGHLTLLRSCMVNADTQAKVAQDLNMSNYIINNSRDGGELQWSGKNLADLLEAFVAALFLDQGLSTVDTFMKTCFFPRLDEFIKIQAWNDPKSCLQQCCLTLRREGQNPDLPIYQTAEISSSSYSSNKKLFRSVVSFRGKAIGEGEASSVHKAERAAATHALKTHEFPQLHWQRKYVQKVHAVKKGKEKKDEKLGKL